MEVLNVQSALYAKAHQMHKHKSLHSQVDSLHSHTKRKHSLSVNVCTQTLSSLLDLMWPEAQPLCSVGIHQQKHKLVHKPMNVNQYLHSKKMLG